jgi:diguanylate cyclase (GGDEF)-like protein
MPGTTRELIDEEGRLAALGRYCVLDTLNEQPFDKITSLVCAVLNVPVCAVSLIDRDRQWFKSIRGYDAQETPRSVAFCSHTIQSADPLIVCDATKDARFASNPLVTNEPAIRSYAGAPLRTPDGYNVGALCVIDTKERQFSAGEVEIISHFAALVIEQLELRMIAQRDFLTGCLTRRAFVELAEKEIDGYWRYGRISSLVVFDIDHFKTINDSFGHPFGDTVLKGLAECCARELRPNDIFGRLGGEEFGIVLAETSPEDSIALVDRLRRRMASTTFAGNVKVTASFGVAPVVGMATVGDWLADADVALYAAKAGGRDRCVVASARRTSAAA